MYLHVSHYQHASKAAEMELSVKEQGAGLARMYPWHEHQRIALQHRLIGVKIWSQSSLQFNSSNKSKEGQKAFLHCVNGGVMQKTQLHYLH